MTKREIEIGKLLYPESDYYKPKTRAECAEGPRPCPYVSCKHHLFIDVSPRTGAIKLNFPDLEPDELRQSCSLDVADRGGETLEGHGGDSEYHSGTATTARGRRVREDSAASPSSACTRRLRAFGALDTVRHDRSRRYGISAIQACPHASNRSRAACGRG
jgi:hypothetical protein